MLWTVLSPITGVFITFTRNIATLLKDFCAEEQKIAKIVPITVAIPVCLSVRKPPDDVYERWYFRTLLKSRLKPTVFIEIINTTYKIARFSVSIPSASQ